MAAGGRGVVDAAGAVGAAGAAGTLVERTRLPSVSPGLGSASGGRGRGIGLEVVGGTTAACCAGVIVMTGAAFGAGCGSAALFGAGRIVANSGDGWRPACR